MRTSAPAWREIAEAFIEAVTKARDRHGERRAERAMRVTLLAMAVQCYELTRAERDRLEPILRGLYERYVAARKSADEWGAIVERLQNELDAETREAQLEHRRMFKSTTIHRFDPETGEVLEEKITFRKADE